MWLLCGVVLAQQPEPDSEKPAPDAEALYEEHCQVCHGKKGRATFPGVMMGAGSFASARFWRDRPEERLRETVVKGGEAMGLKSAMPAFGETLTDAELDAVLAYSLAFRPTE